VSKAAKISLLVAFFRTVASGVFFLMTSAWLNLNTMLFAGSGVAVLVALFFERRTLWEFLTMRTTKHGMNMGVSILMMTILMICLNYMANRYNKSWDLTQEKLNSLSDQSASILKNLKDDLSIKVFTRGPTALEEKQKIKQTLMLYQDNSPHLKIQYVNPYVDDALAMQYLNDLPDRDTAAAVVFVEKGAKRIRVDQPFDEAAVTSALIKVTRAGETKVYFLKGHGEKDIDAESDQSLKDFARSLAEASFKTESFNLMEGKSIPADAAVVAIVGPMTPYLDSELTILRDYLKNGGHLFLAIDPGQRHGLANLTKSLGVEFQNNFVATLAPVAGGGPAMVLGRNFDVTNPITRSFPAGSSYSLFYLASELRPAPDKPPTYVVTDLVKTDTYSFTINDIRQPLREKPQTKPIVLAVSSKGKFAEDPNAKSFEAVIFGDSDFMSNRSLVVGINRDLAMNAIADLSNQADLISIRPKVPKGTLVFLTSASRAIMVIFTLALPLILLITSGVMWYRRRGA
jgi:ABC-type uncharacterized transport system involved in gliding motility auxiliary subunit